ncbi:MAG TPA: Hint domain-containing protein [Bradyrhizobium sp.]|nr:Hint domain-containing protein [Bradyrhizobium sp.]
MISVSQSQQQAIQSAIKGRTDGVKRALHPSNPDDLAAIKTFLELSGKTKDTHPGLYGDIAKLAGNGAKGDGDNAAQVLDIVDQGRDAHGRATSRVWHLDRNGSFMSGSAALVLDTDSGKPLAFGHANRVGGGLAPAATRAATALPATDKITTVGFYHSQVMPAAAPQFGLIAQTVSAAADEPMPDAHIDAPVISASNPNHKEIVIGLGRQFVQADTDYSYTAVSSDAPDLLVPFAGWVNPHMGLANVGSNGQFTSGLVLSTKVYSLTGKSYSQHDSTQSITAQVTGNTTTNQVNWSYPFNQTAPPSTTPSLRYAPLTAPSNTLSAFLFQFQIPVDNLGAPLYPFNVCSTDWPEPPTINCTRIPPLKFVWHCIAEGTRVTLADGSTLEIQKVDNTMRVRTGNGNGTLGVEATTRGLHEVNDATDPAQGVFKLTTAKGRTLVLTGGHPVATEDGLMPASDLTPGSVVRAEDGADKVVSCEPVKFDGVFVNLKLIDAKDRAKGLSGSVGTFIANGAVVGDLESMEQLHYNNTHSLEYMTARLPKHYHTDYASTLATIAHDNVMYGGKY